ALVARENLPLPTPPSSMALRMLFDHYDPMNAQLYGFPDVLSSFCTGNFKSFEQFQTELASGTSLLAGLVSAKKRKRLASLGTSSVLSYLLLKFLKHSIINAVAWYLTAKRLGVSPLQKWPTFLATYAAVYVASTPLQPAKWAVIVAMSPVLDRTMEKISARMGWSKQTTAGAILLGISALGAIVWMLGVLVAGSLARVSIW
ncbi:unnamed protein product, partial [Symbiodinium sp. KB8]